MRTPGPRRTAPRVLAAVALGLGALTACSAADEPEPTSGPTSPAPDASEERTGWTAAEIESVVLGTLPADDVLGSAEGAVPDRYGDHPAVVEVTAVRATDRTTVVWFTLRNVEDGSASLPLEAFNTRSPLTMDVRDVALVDVASGVRYQPYLGVSVQDDTKSFCTCAHAPKQITTKGQLLSATFPAIPEGTTTVALELAGFPLIEDLPVAHG